MLRTSEQAHLSMNFDFFSRETAAQRSADIAHLVIAGWAGRDKAALESHIAELEQAGVPRPEVAENSGVVDVFIGRGGSNNPECC